MIVFWSFDSFFFLSFLFSVSFCLLVRECQHWKQSNSSSSSSSSTKPHSESGGFYFLFFLFF